MSLLGLGLAAQPAAAQERPRLEYDSARGVYVLTYLDDELDWRTVEIVPPNRVDPVAEVTVDDGPPRRYRYRIANRATEGSTQRLWMFKLSCPSPSQASISSTPVDWSGSIVKDASVAEHVCRFMAPHDDVDLPPGESANGFVIVADALPELDTARAWGLRPEPPTLEGTREIEPEEALLLGRALGTRGGWREFPMVVPGSSPPPSDPVENLWGVHSDLRETCELGWIDESRVCNSLEKKLVGAIDALQGDDASSVPDRLVSFLSELEARRGTDVNENAYWLLHLHVREILGSI